MDLTSIDDFLYLKSLNAIKSYFAYLRRGFKLIDKGEVPKEKEHFLKEYFGQNSVPYQAVSTTFVSEVFHIIETYLKSNLLRSGEYLIYPSIDKFPEHKEKLDAFNKIQKDKIKEVLLDFAKASIKQKKDRIKTLSKKVGESLFFEEKEILVNSISCSEALYRLEKYLNWKIETQVKERFRLFIENRNDIIHFNKLTNLTFACSHSLFVLTTFSTSNSTIYPKFSSIQKHIKKDLANYNILVQEILYANEVHKALNNIKEHGEYMSKAFMK